MCLPYLKFSDLLPETQFDLFFYLALAVNPVVHSKTFCMLVNFSWFFSSADYFKINFKLSKNYFRTLSECQTVWILIRPGHLLGLIWVQTVLSAKITNRLQNLPLVKRIYSNCTCISFTMYGHVWINQFRITYCRMWMGMLISSNKCNSWGHICTVIT